MAAAALGSCHMTSNQQGLNKIRRFLRFFGHISLKFYQVCAEDIKSLITSAPVTLETRHKVPIWVNFWHFSSRPFRHKLLDNYLLTKIQFNLCTFTHNERFFSDSNHNAKNKYNAGQISKNLAKFELWYGTYIMPISVLLVRET